jgi:hypothetical protein
MPSQEITKARSRYRGFALKVVLFTPGFSPVQGNKALFENRFNGFPSILEWKPLKRFLNTAGTFPPG